METLESAGLIALMETTKKTTERSRDYIIPTDKMRAVNTVNSVLIDVEGLGSFDITEICHNQIAEKTQIPQKYYDRVKGANPKLLADNINQWLPTKDKRMIRTLELEDKKVCRALLSDRYKPLDNYDLLLTTLNAFNEYKQNTGKNIIIRNSYESETSFYLKALIPDIKADVGEGDIIHAGILISNSEVGKRALSVSPLVYRASCGNDSICVETYKRNHIGNSQGILDVFTDITRRSQDNTIWLEVKDTLKATLDGRFLEEKAKQYRELKGITYDNPKEKIEAITKHYKFSELEAEAILNNFIGEVDKSAYGIFNSVTALGRETKNQDRRIEIERIGDKITLDLLGVKEVELLGEGI